MEVEQLSFFTMLAPALPAVAVCCMDGNRAKGTRVDRAEPSVNDILSPDRMAHSRERLRKTKKEG